MLHPSELVLCATSDSLVQSLRFKDDHHWVGWGYETAHDITTDRGDPGIVVARIASSRDTGSVGAIYVMTLRGVGWDLETYWKQE